MFKIRIQTLPDTGLKIQQNLPPEAINMRLSEAPGASENPIFFTDEIKLNLICDRVPNGMTLSGKINVDCSQLCSLCAKPVVHNVEVNVSHIFKHIEDKATQLLDEDIGLSYYTGEHVDLQPCLEDLLILQLSPYWHPNQDCDGNCSVCKSNPRQGQKTIKIGTQNLGEILASKLSKK